MHGILNHRLGSGFSQVGVLALNSSDYNERCFTLIQSCAALWQHWTNCLRRQKKKLTDPLEVPLEEILGAHFLSIPKGLQHFRYQNTQYIDLN